MKSSTSDSARLFVLLYTLYQICKEHTQSFRMCEQTILTREKNVLSAKTYFSRLLYTAGN
jgi:hypothetical protein